MPNSRHRPIGTDQVGLILSRDAVAGERNPARDRARRLGRGDHVERGRNDLDAASRRPDRLAVWAGKITPGIAVNLDGYAMP